MYSTAVQEPGALDTQLPPHGGTRESTRGSVLVAYMTKTVQGSSGNDAFQRWDSASAIESFRRCDVVEVWQFLWSGGGAWGS